MGYERWAINALSASYLYFTYYLNIEPCNEYSKKKKKADLGKQRIEVCHLYRVYKSMQVKLCREPRNHFLTYILYSISQYQTI